MRRIMLIGSPGIEAFDLKNFYPDAWCRFIKREDHKELLIAQSNIGSIYDFAGGKLLRQEKEEQKR